MPRLLLVLVSLNLVACGSRSSVIASMKGTAANAKNFYTTNCTSCHGPDGRTGSEKHDIVAHAKAEPIEAAEAILNGNKQGMAAYGMQLTDQQAADLLAYVQSL